MKKLGMPLKSILEIMSKAQIASLVIILLAMVFVLLGISRNMDLNENHNEAYIRDFMKKISYSYKLQIDRFINNKIDTLRYICTFPDIYNMNYEQQRNFVMDRSKYLDFRHMFVISNNGNGYYMEENVVRYQRNEEFFSNVMNNDVYITDPWSDAKRFFSIITVCVSMKNPQGEKVGVLCGALDTSKIQDFIGANEDNIRGEYVLINRKGQYISGSRLSARSLYRDKNFFDQENSKLDLIHEVIDSKSDGFGTININGVDYYAYANYLPEYDWVVVQFTDMDIVKRDVNDISYLQYIMVFLAILLFATICRILMRWVVTNKRLFMDHLTGCQNRLAYEMKLDDLENNYNNSIAIIYMDLNKFKMINDTFGHDNGDLLLRIFAQSLQEIFGKLGNVYRIGGDEFVCIMINHTEADILTAEAYLNDLLKEKSDNLPFDYRISVSYGYAIREAGCHDALHIILEQADKSMYEYKQLWRRRNE